jgi:MOSC domain.
MVDATVNPLRFRGNVYVTGWPAWSELDLVGKEVSVGPTPASKSSSASSAAPPPTSIP